MQRSKLSFIECHYSNNFYLNLAVIRGGSKGL